MDLKTVYIIHETDLEDSESYVVGVCSSVARTHEMMREYYGDKAEYSEFRDIRDSHLEYSTKVSVDGGEYRCTIMWYVIDKL